VGRAKCQHDSPLEPLPRHLRPLPQNYAITLLKHGQKSRALQEFRSFDKLFSTLDEQAKQADQDVMQQHNLLKKLFIE
jgi:hypothetical protein